MTWAGVIKQQSGNARSLVKLGAGALVLSGANTYNGTTTVEAGTLYLDGTTTGMADHIVKTGGTLGGTGTVGLATGKLLTVETGGALAPGTVGAPVGTLTVNGAATLQADTTYAWQYLNGAGYRVVVNGTLTLPAAATVNVSGSGALPATMTLFTASSLDGATDLSGWTVNGLTDGKAQIQGTSVILKTAPAGTMITIR